MLQRTEVTAVLADFLRQMPQVNALWEGGAASFSRVDEWSDIDLLADADDNTGEEVMKRVTEMLDSKFGIELKYDIVNGWPGLTQTFFRLKNSSPFMLIDLGIVKNSATDKFLESEIHGSHMVHFDKANVIQPTAINKEALLNKLQQRLPLLKTRFEIFQVFVEKEINRGNHIEAIGFYMGYTLNPLVEALRMAYAPYHWNFSFRYIHYDLPQNVVQQLQPLYFIGTPTELKTKWQQAKEMFAEAFITAEARLHATVHPLTN